MFSRKMAGKFHCDDTVGFSCKNEWRLSSLWLNTANHRVLPWTLLRIDVPSAILDAMRLDKSECLVGFGAVSLMLVIDVSALFHVLTVDTQSSISVRFLEFNNSLIT